MKKKGEKGSITLFVIFAGLFFVTFLTSMLILGAVKRQAQLESSKQTENIYSEGNQQQVYEGYFGENSVPIYTKEQLEKMCSGEQIAIKEEGGKIYTFSSNSVYILKDDISFEYNGIWQIPAYFGESGRIEGQQKKITIRDTSKVEETYYYYTNSNNYTEPLTKEGYLYSGLILHYDGVNNTGNGHDNTVATWKDLSGNAKDGVVVGTDNSSNSGWSNNCFMLDGEDDGISLGNTMRDLFNTENTIEILVEFEESNARDIIIGNYAMDKCINYEKASSSEKSNKIRIWFKDGKLDELTTNEVLKIQKKQTLTWVFDKNNNKLSVYQDSTLQHLFKSDEFGAYNGNWGNSWIGRDSRTGETVLKGKIYSVRVYNKTLSEEEISQNYQIDKERYAM